MRNAQATSNMSHNKNIIDIIDRCIHEIFSSTQNDNVTEEDIYEYVMREISHLEIVPIQSTIRGFIASRMREGMIASENEYLRAEIARLLYLILSNDKNLDTSNLENVSFGKIPLRMHTALNQLADKGVKVDGEEFLNLVFPVLSTGSLIDSMRANTSALFDSKKRIQLFHQRVDFLTGLPTYTKCLEDMHEDRKRSIVLFHINNMFDINDAFGRSTGDDIVIKIGKLLQRYCRENPNQGSILYKFEGTDFAIIFNGEVTKEHILDQYEKIKDLKIFDSKSRKDIHLSFSLGVVFDESNIERLLHRAFHALKISRQTRKIMFLENDIVQNDASGEFFKMRRLVKEAFTHDLFELSFQEIRKNSCSIRKRDSRKFECLVRMYDSIEKINLIPPGRFLHVIKRDGKNQALTNIVVQKTCEFMELHAGDFSINITEDDLRSDDFAMRMRDEFSKYSITPNRVTFEILEEIEGIESDDILSTITALKSFGFEIAIDDFGSGYSNFARMLDFRPNSLKIDMKYIRGIDTNKQHRSLVKAIVGLAHDNEMYVVAEGIETPNEQLVIESLGVDYSQGYLIGKPLPYIINTDI